jgi:hypothetical protein
VSTFTWRRPSRRAHRLLATLTFSVGTAVLLLSSGALAAATDRFELPGLSPVVSGPSNTYLATASLGANVGSHSGTPFYALVFTDSGLGPVAAADLGHYFNSTPFTWFRLGDGGAGYDPSTQTDWVAPASGVGQYVPQSGNLINLTWFEAWCDSRTPHCSWIAALPGEQNNTTAAVHLAEYYHNVLHFSPTAWEIGNEPNAWKHYGINSSKWSTTDNSTPTGIGYATMVSSYIRAVSKLFPTDQFIGIESNCACGASLVSTTAEVDGAKVMAMAYHSYPWANDSSNKTAQFMGALESPTRNLSYTASHMRELDTALCTTCANLPIQVGEYNAGPVPVHSPIAMNYSGAPFIAASIIEALQANVSMFTLYSLSWLYNSSTAVEHPEGILYQDILSNMTMGSDFMVNVNVAAVGGVFAMLIKNGTHESLLIVNTNNTRAISLPIGLTLFPVGHLGSTWSWDPRSHAPIVSTGVTLPTTYVVWSQGILLINNW